MDLIVLSAMLIFMDDITISTETGEIHLYGQNGWFADFTEDIPLAFSLRNVMYWEDRKLQVIVFPGTGYYMNEKNKWAKNKTKTDMQTSFLYNVSKTENDNDILEWIEKFESRKDAVKHMEYL